jgi:hypothetical protein
MKEGETVGDPQEEHGGQLLRGVGVVILRIRATLSPCCQLEYCTVLERKQPVQFFSLLYCMDQLDFSWF